MARKYCLTKAELADTIFDLLEIDKPKATQVIEDFLEIIKQALEKEGKVMISGFGTFLVNEKKPRKGRNPQTGESLILRERKVLRFKPSNLLRNAVNGIKTPAGQSEED